MTHATDLPQRSRSSQRRKVDGRITNETKLDISVSSVCSVANSNTKSMTSKILSIFDKAAIDRLRSELKFEPRELEQLRAALVKKFRGVETALGELPEEVREEFRHRVVFHPLAIHCRSDSERDGATKLVLQTSRGFLIESVILRTGTGRVSLCVSSQVGCAANCDFCATGKMGVAHNLAAAAMLDQVVLAGELLAAEGRRVP